MYRDGNCSGRSRSQLDEEAVECIMREGSIPEDWGTGLIVPIWKGKDDVEDGVSTGA